MIVVLARLTAELTSCQTVVSSVRLKTNSHFEVKTKVNTDLSFMWMWYHKNARRDFLPIAHKCPLIRFWWSKVEAAVTSQIHLLPLRESSYDNWNKTLHKDKTICLFYIQKVKGQLHWVQQCSADGGMHAAVTIEPVCVLPLNWTLFHLFRFGMSETLTASTSR